MFYRSAKGNCFWGIGADWGRAGEFEIRRGYRMGHNLTKLRDLSNLRLPTLKDAAVISRKREISSGPIIIKAEASEAFSWLSASRAPRGQPPTAVESE